MFGSLARRRPPQNLAAIIAKGKLMKQSPNDMPSFDRQPKVMFAGGTDRGAVTEALQKLLVSGGAGGRWTLIPSGKGLERNFKFKTFATTWDFLTAVSLQCKLKRHHPVWSNNYNTTYIRWSTHSPPGLSKLDVEMAAICDALASDFKEEAEESEGSGGGDDEKTASPQS
ncbi:pterin 4 alpha carbinolamine dehydratase-domain-containing protein [Nemania sp. NC0429]|nr:pterin 4 alpha carbinolamine dehydratase-domain-containing protein [Nemania sp. NC0429]